MLAVIPLLFLLNISSNACVAVQIWSESGTGRSGLVFFFFFNWLKFSEWKVLQLYAAVPALLALGRCMLHCLTCKLVGTKLTNQYWNSWVRWSQISVKYFWLQGKEFKGQISYIFEPLLIPCFVARATPFGLGGGVNTCIYKHLVNDYSGCSSTLKCSVDIGMLNIGLLAL